MGSLSYQTAGLEVVVTAVDPGPTATGLTGVAGRRSGVGSEAIVTAAEDTVGLSGRFMDRDGQVSW